MSRPLHVPSAFQPLRASTEVLALARALTADLRNPSIVAVPTTAHRYGGPVLTVKDALRPTSAVDVVEVMCRAVTDVWRGLVVVSCRRPSPADLDDVDRWYEMCDLCAAAGVELLDWVVDSVQPVSIAEFVGQPPPRGWRRDVCAWVDAGRSW